MQIDFFSRFVGGRLSELFGPATLALDIESRRMMWKSVCTENLSNTPQKYLDIINAYVDGVNTHLENCRHNASLVPPEYAEYDAPLPANFTAVDTFYILKAMSLGLYALAPLYCSRGRRDGVHVAIASYSFVQTNVLTRSIGLATLGPK